MTPKYTPNDPILRFLGLSNDESIDKPSSFEPYPNKNNPEMARPKSNSSGPDDFDTDLDNE